MYLFCKQVKIQNHEYHYHYTTPPPHPTKKYRQTTKQIMVSTTAEHLQSISHDRDMEQVTLLERIRRRRKSDLFNNGDGKQTRWGNGKGKRKGKEEEERKPIEKRMEEGMEPEKRKYGELEQGDSDEREEFVGRCSLDSSSKVSLQENAKRISFALTKDMCSSQTFHEEQDINSDQMIIEEQSLLIQQSISGKFLHLRLLQTTPHSTQHLAIDLKSSTMVTLKQFNSPDSLSHLNEHLHLLSTVPAHPNILCVYETVMERGQPILIMQPYESSRPQESDKDNIRRDMLILLRDMAGLGVDVREICPSDLRQCMGVWKMADLGAFGTTRRTVNGLDNLEQLLNQIQ